MISTLPAVISGDPFALEAAADRFDAVIAGFRETADTIGSHGRKVTSEWVGSASDAAGAHIEKLSKRTRVGAEALAGVPGALRSFAAVLRRCQETYDDAEANVTFFTNAVVGASARVEAAQRISAIDFSRSLEAASAGADLRTAQHNLAAAQEAMTEAVAEALAANEAAAEVVRAAVGELAAMDGAALTGASPASGGLGLSVGDVKEHTAQAPLGGAYGTAAAVRQRLAGMGEAELEEYLRRNPVVARQLVTSIDRPPQLAGELIGGYVIVRYQTSAEVEQRFSGLSTDELVRLGLLYPGVLGNLDGVPPVARVAANRVTITVARDDQRVEVAAAEQALVLVQAGLETYEKARLRSHADPDSPFVLPGSHMLIPGATAAWEFQKRAEVSAAEARLKAAQRRLKTLDALLDDDVDDRARRPDPAVPWGNKHQVLAFDPTGDGKIVEQWGTIDEQTEHIAVFIPGTTVDLNSAILPGENGEPGWSDKARRIAAVGDSQKTAAIYWADMDLPDEVMADAKHAEYARAGGPTLDSFVAAVRGLSTADVTIVPHSYGAATVGAADVIGLHADKIVYVEPGGGGPGVVTSNAYDAGQSEYIGDEVQRFTMTHPLDPIVFAQMGDLLGVAVNGATGLVGVDSDLGLGNAPTYMRFGVDSKSTGWLGPDGELTYWVDAHGDVLKESTTAWDNINDVVQMPTGSRVDPE